MVLGSKWISEKKDASDAAFARTRVGKYFKLDERGSTLSRDILAGTVTFFTMAYILPVNSGIISDTGGTCVPEFEPFTPEYDECKIQIRKDLITATAVASGVACLFMGVFANMPIVLAPGMGLNAYFAYTVVGFAGSGSISYGVALGAILIEGIIFFLLSILGVRQALAVTFPRCVKIAMTAGIGLFLTHIGLQASEGIGLVTYDPATLVHLGGCQPQYRSYTGPYEYDAATESCVPPSAGANYACDSHELTSQTTWLGIFGFCLMSICLMKKVRAGMLVGIFTISIMSWFRGTNFTYFPDTPAGDAKFDYFKKVATFEPIQKTWMALEINLSQSQTWVALITFLYTDLLDATGTMQAVATKTGMVEPDGSFEGQTAAFCSDAAGIIFGALLGCSPITAFSESAAGIESGGRTGIVAIWAAICFFAAIFLSPIVSSIPPWATGGALIVTGSLMMECIVEVDWMDKKQAIPAFATLAMMPLTYSIAYGIISGLTMAFVMYTSHYLWEIACKRMTFKSAWAEIQSGEITGRNLVKKHHDENEVVKGEIEAVAKGDTEAVVKGEAPPADKAAIA